MCAIYIYTLANTNYVILHELTIYYLFIYLVVCHLFIYLKKNSLLVILFIFLFNYLLL